jgi:hypothetical protein
LKVADLERSIRFYSGVLGLQIMQRLGDSAAFLSAGGYHHRVALNTWDSLGGPPPPPGATGLYHSAIVYPTSAALAAAAVSWPCTRVASICKACSTNRKPTSPCQLGRPICSQGLRAKG